MPDSHNQAAILSTLRDALSWAPDWASGLALLVIAAIVALIAHRLIVMVFRRAFGEHHPLLRSILQRASGPLRLALLAFALGITLQSGAFAPAMSETLGRLLLIVFIALAGWIAISRSRPRAASICCASRSRPPTTSWPASTSRRCALSSAPCTRRSS